MGGNKLTKKKKLPEFCTASTRTADLRVQNSKTGSAINAQFCGLRELFFLSSY